MYIFNTILTVRCFVNELHVNQVAIDLKAYTVHTEQKSVSDECL